MTSPSEMLALTIEYGLIRTEHWFSSDHESWLIGKPHAGLYAEIRRLLVDGEDTTLPCEVLR